MWSREIKDLTLHRVCYEVRYEIICSRVPTDHSLEKKKKNWEEKNEEEKASDPLIFNKVSCVLLFWPSNNFLYASPKKRMRLFFYWFQSITYTSEVYKFKANFFDRWKVNNIGKPFVIKKLWAGKSRDLIGNGEILNIFILNTK